jgi:hypothetical protein
MNAALKLLSLAWPSRAARITGGRSRRGIAVLLVLGMLAMTLALSYASLRGQATVAQLAENLGRGEDARLAAESGIYAALRKMSDGSWAGISSTMTGNVTDNSWYEVSFVTGDGPLPPGDPLYNPGEFAYRVTITSNGYSSDPSQPSLRAVHRVDAIVQLARRTLLPEPANWSTFANYTVYQWGNREITVQEPVRINGQAAILGRMLFSQQYPLTTESRDAYLSGLNEMRQEGRGDHRPFASPLTIAVVRQDAATLTMLSKLGLVTVDSLAATTAPVTHPNTVMGYRLYPGGKVYLAPIIQDDYGSTLQDVTLAPDPIENPLGVFRNQSSLNISNNVTVRGTIIGEGTSSDIQVVGTGVKFEGLNLAPIEGSSQVYQLPVVVLRDDLRMHPTSNVVVQGLAMVYDEFELKQGSTAIRFALTGKLVTSGLRLRGRDPWQMTATAWDDDYDNFRGSGGLLGGILDALLDTIRNTLGLGPGDEVFFPEYMQHVRGFMYQPVLTFQPPTSGVQFHWHNWSQGVYQKDPTDPGLRWNLIRWVEGS